MTPEQAQELIDQLTGLNQNFRNLREHSADLKRLASQLKTLNDRFKHLLPLAKQLNILNQILVQVSKSAGVESMVSTLIKAFAKMAR